MRDTLADALALTTGIGNFVQGPFLCFNKVFGPSDIQSSLDHLQAFIDEEGTFDGILGFSQGGSLALTYLLQEAMTVASDSDSSSSSSISTPTFKFAIMLSTIVAFSPDPDYCSDLLCGLTPADQSLLRNFPHESAHADYKSLSRPPARAVFFESLGRLLDTSFQVGFLPPDTDLGLASLGEESHNAKVPRLMHPELLPPDIRVRIPTVHVVGRKDDPVLVELSGLMEKFCEPHLRRRLVHDGGHDVPRGAKDVKALWAAVEWAVSEGLRQAWEPVTFT